MKKTKKGYTLIEVITGMLILGVALILGVQTFAVAGTGYTRAAALDHGVDTIFNVFEGGTKDIDLPANVTKSTAKIVNVTVKIISPLTGGAKMLTKSHALTQVSFIEKDVSASLYGLSSTYGMSK